MGRQHHQFGCLLCGKLRSRADATKYDLMLKDTVSRSIVRVSLCKTCFEFGDYDLRELTERLIESERDFADKKGKPMSSVFESVNFVGVMTTAAYWAKVRELYPNGGRLTNQNYLEIITDARE